MDLETESVRRDKGVAEDTAQNNRVSGSLQAKEASRHSDKSCVSCSLVPLVGRVVAVLDMQSMHNWSGDPTNKRVIEAFEAFEHALGKMETGTRFPDRASALFRRDIPLYRVQTVREAGNRHLLTGSKE